MSAFVIGNVEEITSKQNFLTLRRLVNAKVITWPPLNNCESQSGWLECCVHAMQWCEQSQVCNCFTVDSECITSSLTCSVMLLFIPLHLCSHEIMVRAWKATDIMHSNVLWLVMARQGKEEYEQLAYLYRHSEQFPWSPAAACYRVHLSS